MTEAPRPTRPDRLLARAPLAALPVAFAGALLLGGCAALGLGDVILPPRISEAPDRQSQLRVLAPAADLPMGGVAVRLWTRVENPNPFGLNLSRLEGDFFLRAERAAGVEFPLGLPLLAGQDTVIPLEVSLSFADVPRLAELIPDALLGRSIAYRLDGVVTLDAGPAGRPSFGPSTWLEGEVQVTR